MMRTIGKTLDISELKQDVEELRASNQGLALLVETAGQLLRSDSPQEVIDSLCRKVLAFLDCQAFFNYLVDFEKQRLHLNACGGIPDEDIRKMEWLEYGTGLCGCSARDGCRLVVEDLQQTDDEYTALVRPFGIQAYACHPLLSQGKVLGTLSFCSRTRKRFTEEELSLMQAVADQVAIAMERKMATERIALSEQKLRAFFEGARDAIFITTEDCRFVDCNPAAVEMFGCSKEELLEKKPFNLSPYTQTDGQVSLEKAQKLHESALRGDPQGFEWTHQRNDGSQFDAFVVLNCFEMNGKLMTQSIVRDISEKKKAETALRESEARYRRLFEDAVLGIFQSTPEGELLAVNPALVGMFGYDSPDEMKTCVKNMAKELYVDPKRRKEILLQMEERPGLVNFENVYRRKDGSTFVGNLHLRFIRRGDGCVNHLEGFIEDITERKMLEQKFIQAQKMDAVGQLASGIAHEFNNIMMAILGYGNLLQPLVESDPQGSKFTTQMTMLAKRAANLTHDLLTFSRKHPSQPIPMDLNEIVRKTENLLKWLLGENQELKMILKQEVMPAFLISGQIEQVLINLATNARDAMPNGGVLTVKTAVVSSKSESIKGHVNSDVRKYGLISVSDSGIGMDEKTKEKIFDPFFTTKEVGKGTGLGLAMVYGIVQQHEGYIIVDSKRGKGSRFTIYLPLIDVCMI